LTEYYCESYNLKKGYQKLSKLLFGLPTDFSYSIRICALWAKESESERIKKTNDFRPLDTPWRDASVFWNRADCSSRGTGIQTIRSNFPPVHGARIYDDSPFSENSYESLLDLRPSALRNRLIAIETIRSRENFLANRIQFGTETIAVSLNRRETWHKFNCAINLKYYQ